MKRTSKRTADMSSEYRFDYSKARPNRFARRWDRRSGMVVLIDADMADVFRTSEAVNRALHALAGAVPSQGTRGH